MHPNGSASACKPSNKTTDRVSHPGRSRPGVAGQAGRRGEGVPRVARTDPLRGVAGDSVRPDRAGASGSLAANADRRPGEPGVGQGAGALPGRDRARMRTLVRLAAILPPSSGSARSIGAIPGPLGAPGRAAPVPPGRAARHRRQSALRPRRRVDRCTACSSRPISPAFAAQALYTRARLWPVTACWKKPVIVTVELSQGIIPTRVVEPMAAPALCSSRSWRATSVSCPTCTSRVRNGWSAPRSRRRDRGQLHAHQGGRLA